MAAVAFVLGAITIATPIPFWDKRLALDATLGINIACSVITSSISIYYDRTWRWVATLPVHPATAVATLVLSRASTAVLACTAAAAGQALLFSVLGDPKQAGRFLLRMALISTAISAVLIPWSVLARLAFGRVAGSWALVGIALASAAIATSSPGACVKIMAWVVPWLPTTADPVAVSGWRSWAYVAAHATAVSAVATPLLRRVR